MSLLIMVSGPTSSESEALKEERLARLNEAAAEVLARGRVDLVGVNAAGPVVERVRVGDRYEAVMPICLALAERCGAVLLIDESGGACRKAEVFERTGRTVYRRLDERPDASGNGRPA